VVAVKPLPAHVYEVLGIAVRREWSVVLSTEWMSLVGREG
jgi:hypothetical protein